MKTWHELAFELVAEWTIIIVVVISYPFVKAGMKVHYSTSKLELLYHVLLLGLLSASAIFLYSKKWKLHWFSLLLIIAQVVGLSLVPLILVLSVHEKTGATYLETTWRIMLIIAVLLTALYYLMAHYSKRIGIGSSALRYSRTAVAAYLIFNLVIILIVVN